MAALQLLGPEMSVVHAFRASDPLCQVFSNSGMHGHNCNNDENRCIWAIVHKQ